MKEFAGYWKKNYKHIDFKIKLMNNSIRVEAKTKIGAFTIEPLLQFDDLEESLSQYKNYFIFENGYTRKILTEINKKLYELTDKYFMED